MQAVLVELNTTHYIIEIQTVYYVDVRVIQNYPKDPLLSLDCDELGGIIAKLKLELVQSL